VGNNRLAEEWGKFNLYVMAVWLAKGLIVCNRRKRPWTRLSVASTAFERQCMLFLLQPSLTQQLAELEGYMMA